MLSLRLQILIYKAVVNGFIVIRNLIFNHPMRQTADFQQIPNSGAPVFIVHRPKGLLKENGKCCSMEGICYNIGSIGKVSQKLPRPNIGNYFMLGPMGLCAAYLNQRQTVLSGKFPSHPNSIGISGYAI